MDGSYFEVMGLHPVMGRLLGPADDGPNAAGAVVLTHRFWTTSLKNDPTVLGRSIRLGTRTATVVGIAADVDDENIEPGALMLVYHPFEQEIGGGRLFVHVRSEPYALVPPITRIVRDLSTDQPVERASTLEDVRAEVLAPTRLNALVFGGFAAVALAIAVVGVAGVLAFSVSGRTREFGIRLAIGYIQDLQFPDFLPVDASAIVLLVAAVVASVVPAARAARVDVMQALRAD